MEEKEKESLRHILTEFINANGRWAVSSIFWRLKVTIMPCDKRFFPFE